jgi:GAF domain-containing protein
MYDPLVVDTFIRVHAEIAPLATRAGQDARSMISEHAAALAVNQEPLKEIRSNAFENSLLSELTHSLNQVRTTPEAIHCIAQHLRQLIPASVYVLYNYDLDSDTLVATHAVGDEQGLIHGLAIRVGERITGWSAANRRTALNSDAHLDLGAVADAFNPPLNSALSTPVVAGERLVAVLSSYSGKREAFSKSHAYIIEHVAGLLAHEMTSPHTGREKTPLIALKAANR